MLEKSNRTKTEQPTKVDKNDYGDSFVAPDGGWGWLVCLAAGISNLCIFPGVQVFGLIYREKLNFLEFTNSQITTIMNCQNATSSGTGLLNGPMFRKLTFRQVGMLGAFFVSLGLFLSVFANSFAAYIICYSIVFGFGSGITVSATSLALNTYFKEKRRKATSLTWTITGLGPFIFPFITTMILPHLGFRGTVWFFTGISMHAFASALVYQPVKWHTKISIDTPEYSKKFSEEAVILCRFCQSNLESRKQSKIFSSQYLLSEDIKNAGIREITAPETLMMARANDGWYGSTANLNKLGRLTTQKNLKKACDEEMGRGDSKKITRIASSIALGSSYCTCQGQNRIMEQDEIESNEQTEEEMRAALKWYEKVIMFFDLNLLKDLTFVNLMTGMTLTTFADFNFTVLMPFFLADFGFSKGETAVLMSLIAGSDILMRFLVPFLVEDIKWDNRIFFLIAVSGMTCGRMVLAHRPSYGLAIFLFLWIGAFKGLRTIFLAIIIPSHVPLKRLPAASGLQLLTSGLFTLSCGPIVGIIRDNTNYTMTLHFLNAISTTTLVTWTVQLIYEWYHRKYADTVKEPGHSGSSG